MAKTTSPKTETKLILTIKCSFDGIEDDAEKEKMKQIVSDCLYRFTTYEVASTWVDLATEIGYRLDIADNRRYRDRLGWAVLVAKAAAYRPVYTKKMTASVSLNNRQVFVIIMSNMA
jgi:hypothetical protein